VQAEEHGGAVAFATLVEAVLKRGQEFGSSELEVVPEVVVEAGDLPLVHANPIGVDSEQLGAQAGRDAVFSAPLRRAA